MKKSIFVFVFAYLFGIYNLQSQEVVLTENCKSAYEDILSLKFGGGRILLQSEKAENPDNVYTDYLENYIDFLQLFIGENEDDFKFLEHNKSERIKKINKLDDSSPYKKYMLGNIHLQWAVARLKFNEYFTAAFEINKAYRLLEANNKDFPDFIPNKISLGLLHILIGLVPDNYQWVLDLISMKGNVEQGRAELADVLQKSTSDPAVAYLRDETLFYIGFVELNINPDRKYAINFLYQIEDAKQDNLLLSYLCINILIRTGQNEKAIAEFAKLPTGRAYYPFYYLNYLEGECLLNKLEFTEAYRKYRLFLTSFSGKNYLKDAIRKMAWTALLAGDTLTYFDHLDQVSKIGSNDIDVDKQAIREADEHRVPQIDLLKARLLFDGGYYLKSDSIITQINFADLTVDQNLEVLYRKARIADESGEIEQAKKNYKSTIEKGQDSKRYFAGNAALKLAGIYESEGNLSQAEHYYRTCLKMDFTEYRSSIRTKAKAGLKRVTADKD